MAYARMSSLAVEGLFLCIKFNRNVELAGIRKEVNSAAPHY